MSRFFLAVLAYSQPNARKSSTIFPYKHGDSEQMEVYTSKIIYTFDLLGMFGVIMLSRNIRFYVNILKFLLGKMLVKVKKLLVFRTKCWEAWDRKYQHFCGFFMVISVFFVPFIEFVVLKLQFVVESKYASSMYIGRAIIVSALCASFKLCLTPGLSCPLQISMDAFYTELRWKLRPDVLTAQSKGFWSDLEFLSKWSKFWEYSVYWKWKLNY